MTDDGTQKYVWDIAGRLKEVWKHETGGDTLIAEFKYDAYGRRVSHHALSTDDTAYYYYDGWRVLEEYIDPWDGDTYLEARNVWGLYLDETVVRTAMTGSIGQADYYPVLNPIYSPLRLYDGNGNLQARIRYTPYGRPSAIDANGAPILVAEGLCGMIHHDYPHLFTGQRYDIKAGLSYYKYRFYSPQYGRFLSRDPIARFYNVTNHSAYVDGASPVLWTDPLGLKKLIVNVIIPTAKFSTNKDILMKLVGLFSDWKEPFGAWITADKIAVVDQQKDLVQALKEVIRSCDIDKYDPTGKCGDCILLLRIIAHGNPGSLYYGPTSLIGGELSRDEKEYFNKIRPLFCEDGMVQLYSCGAGQGNEGQKMIQNLADTFGVPVSAPTGSVGNPGFEWEGDPGWITAFPGAKNIVSTTSAYPPLVKGYGGTPK